MAKIRSPEAQAYHFLYHTPGWRKIRAEHLAIEPYCRMCRRAKRQTLAVTVDHIEPHRGNRALFFSRSNLQALCSVHANSSKQRIEGGGKPRMLIGEDGWPR